MKLLWFNFIFIFILPLSFSTRVFACSNQDESECGFYCQKFSELKCSRKNYLNAFGYRYCRAYLNDKAFTPEAKVVLAGIRSCLIQKLKERDDLTCGNVKSIALASHEACYKENHFCSIGLNDKIEVFNVASRILFEPAYFGIVETILTMCGPS